MATIKKMQAGGVAKQLNPKAKDETGAFISVQKKYTDGYKCGGKVKSKKKACHGGKFKKH